VGGSGTVVSVANGGMRGSSIVAVGVTSGSSGSMSCQMRVCNHVLQLTVSLSPFGASFPSRCSFVPIILALLFALFLFPLTLCRSAAWLLFGGRRFRAIVF